MCRNSSAASFTACTTCGCAWPVRTPRCRRRNRGSGCRRRPRLRCRGRATSRTGSRADTTASITSASRAISARAFGPGSSVWSVAASAAVGFLWMAEHRGYSVCGHARHRPARAPRPCVRAGARSVTSSCAVGRGTGTRSIRADASGQPTAARASSTVASANSAVSAAPRVSGCGVRMPKSVITARGPAAARGAARRAPWPSRNPPLVRKSSFARSCAASP